MTLHETRPHGRQNRAASGEVPRAAMGSHTSGVLGMLLATFLWGCSFTWVKAAGAGINEALERAPGAALGPLALLGWRFLLAAALWALLHPKALSGWTRRAFRDGAWLGLSLAVPMTFQVLGLDRTTEAVSAFLTSLTIVFVPLTLAVLFRRAPRPATWGAVSIAGIGIWLMTGAAPTGFGLGELLGLSCGISFTAHILLIDRVMKRESLGRMTFAQFLFVGLASLGVAAVSGGAEVVTPGGVSIALRHELDTVAPTVASVLAGSSVLVNLLLVTLVSTLGAFTLQFAFQPRVSPTMASVLLLAEPVFAALFAYVMLSRALGPHAIIGALLILVANVVAIRLEAAGGRAHGA